MRAPAVTLFVEFEGVLRPAGADVRPLPFGPVLSELLGQQMQHVEIVVSDRSALREPLQTLRRQLPDDVASRVVDSVYLPELMSSAWSDYFSDLATRYAMIELWLKRKRSGGSNGWLALEKGCQIDSWPITEYEHVVWGTLGDAMVRQKFVRQLLAQIYGARNLNRA